MIVWCKECGDPMEYRDGCGLKYPHYDSAKDQPSCGQCSLRWKWEDNKERRGYTLADLEQIRAETWLHRWLEGHGRWCDDLIHGPNPNIIRGEN